MTDIAHITLPLTAADLGHIQKRLIAISQSLLTQDQARGGVVCSACGRYESRPWFIQHKDICPVGQLIDVAAVISWYLPPIKWTSATSADDSSKIKDNDPLFNAGKDASAAAAPDASNDGEVR